MNMRINKKLLDDLHELVLAEHITYKPRTLDVTHTQYNKTTCKKNPLFKVRLQRLEIVRFVIYTVTAESTKFICEYKHHTIWSFSLMRYIFGLQRARLQVCHPRPPNM